MNAKPWAVVGAIAVLGALGCEQPSGPKPAANVPPGPPPAVAAPPGPPALPPPASAAAEPSTAAADPTPLPADAERVKAQAGVGAKGRSLDPHEGLLVTPAKAYFSARERIVFEVQLVQALQLYEASEGQAPRTHEEYMERVVQANGIQLPALPAGHKYVYDPALKELQVERPRR